MLYQDKLSAKEAKIEREFNLELIELIDKIKSKYTLSFINIELTKNKRFAIKFLKKFDSIAEEVARDMEMPTEFIGLKGNIGLNYDNSENGEFTDPYYYSVEKSINFCLWGLNKNSLLHEWIHALDNYVCYKCLNINDYVSEQNGILLEPKEQKEINYSYYKIRELTEKISNKRNLYYIGSKFADVTGFLFGIPKGYFTQPIEMLARYFESQVYNTSCNIKNLGRLILFSLPYKITTDENFKETKEYIIKFLHEN